MRIYFISKQPAALLLGGIFYGYVDGFERFIDCTLTSPPLFIEVAPCANFNPIRFALTREFLTSPPEYVSVYSIGDDYAVCFEAFNKRAAGVNVISQTRLNGKLATLFDYGGVQLSIEALPNSKQGEQFKLIDLDDTFLTATLSTERVADTDFFVLKTPLADDLYLNIYTVDGAEVFKNKVSDAQFSDRLVTEIRFKTVMRHSANAVWSYNRRESRFELTSYTLAAAPVCTDKSGFCVAFFEEVLVCGEYERYLCDELKPRAKEIKKYLNDFTDVTLPCESMLARRGAIDRHNVAGLVYPTGKNTYRVDFFEIELKDGLISNIRPFE